MSEGPVRVGDMVEAVLDRKGLKNQVRRTSALGLWRDAVGGRIADVTEPRSVNGTALIVEVRSSAWLMELDLMKVKILEKLNRELPESPMEKIVFVLAGDTTTPED